MVILAAAVIVLVLVGIVALVADTVQIAGRVGDYPAVEL